MKKEDLVGTIVKQTWLSKKVASKVMNAVFEERERLVRNGSLEVRTSPIHGRGVFAAGDIPANVILEECHFIQLKETNFENLDPALKDYVFLFPRGSRGDARTYAIPLGISSIMNHSHDNPNATWTTNESRWLFIFTSLKSIQAGKEILMDYDRG